ncbi:hypothetical protein [Bradyrhizobium sp. USDA 4353]
MAYLPLVDCAIHKMDDESDYKYKTYLPPFKADPNPPKFSAPPPPGPPAYEPGAVHSPHGEFMGQFSDRSPDEAVARQRLAAEPSYGEVRALAQTMPRHCRDGLHPGTRPAPLSNSRGDWRRSLPSSGDRQLLPVPPVARSDEAWIGNSAPDSSSALPAFEAMPGFEEWTFPWARRSPWDAGQ